MRNRLLVSAVLAALALPFAICERAAAQSPSTVSIRLTSALSTDGNHAGDRFTGTLAEPLVMNGRIVARKDAMITGQVTEVVSSGRLARPALLTLRLRTIQSRTARYPLETGDLTIKADSHAPRNVLIIGGSAGAGAVIGGAAAGGKGAAFGALAGAGAGTLGALLTGKREITLPSETVLTFYVTTLTISPKELAQMQPVQAPLLITPVYEDRAAPPRRDDDQNEYRVVSRRPYDDRDEDYGAPPAQTRDVYVVGSARLRYPVFPQDERVVIIRWFGREQRNLPKGLAKHDRLPPGLEKQLRERGTLPPGLQKRAQPLPFELERQLRPVPAGYHRIAVSGSVMLVDDQTSIVCDIIRY